jgi:glyoxylase-like metal-dependent hydrolase (beta-lactamase superfamily II)
MVGMTATDQLTAPLETPFPGLHALPAAPLPFATDLHSRAFLLEREHGNVLVYSSAAAPTAAAAVQARGGVAWQYLNHWHESLFAIDEVVAAFGAPVVVHEDDAAETAARLGADPVTFTGRHALGEGFELIPTPGHTPGATTYLWEHAGHRFLFTGDTIYLHEDEWIGAVLDSSDRAAYLDSLELLRDLDFDVLVPWAASAGHPFHALTDRADARRRIDAIIARVRGGADR